MVRAIAILEEMWDWRSMTSGAGYVERAPSHFQINEDNFTGRRLYDFLGHHDLLVTNACPELVTSASGRGKPDKKWLSNNLRALWPFELLLVCGKVAQQTYSLADTMDRYSPRQPRARVIEMPHPAARTWTRSALAWARRLIQEGSGDLSMRLAQGRLVVTPLIPF